MDAEELLENFELFDTWEDRYRYLIDLGKTLDPMPEEHKTAENKVHGCLSQVWLVKNSSEESLSFLADSDSAIVRGLIAIVMVLFNGQPKERAANIDAVAIFDQIGFGSHISMNRRNGFAAMVQKVRALATA